MYLMTDEPSKTMDIQNASVPQLTSLLTDPALTAIPHQKTFLNLVNHKDAWATPMISVYAQIKDGLAAPSAPSPPAARIRSRPSTTWPASCRPSSTRTGRSQIAPTITMNRQA